MPGEVVIVAADRIAKIPGYDPFWAIERLDNGALGSRANGVMLYYSMGEDAVRTHGLPHISQVEAAFREDALDILKTTYKGKETGNALGPALTREFPPHALAHQGEWAAALQEIRQGRPPAEGGNPSTFHQTKHSSTKNSSILSNPALRKGMIVTGVALGAALTGYSHLTL